MKTKIITELKKEILVIEFPEGYELAGVTHGAIYYYDNQMNYEDYPLSILVEGSYTLLGSPDEIKEEDVVDLCDRIGINNPLADCDFFADYGNDDRMFETALESFNSALDDSWISAFEEAQEKTFDKKRTLIFVKN